MTTTNTHKGWHSRGYLPHFDQPGLLQGITFRLHDSMPAELRSEWERLIQIKQPDRRHARIQEYLDAGRGSCWLADAPIGSLVEDALLYFDNERYRLLAWVVMPNHVHVLIEIVPGHPLSDILYSWKSYTGRMANRLLAREGDFWHVDYYDRFIRDEKHLERAVLYIHGNPVKAGLVERAEDWPWSSARYVDALDATVAPPPG
jgi:putative transposase